MAGPHHILLAANAQLAAFRAPFQVCSMEELEKSNLSSNGLNHLEFVYKGAAVVIPDLLTIFCQNLLSTRQRANANLASLLYAISPARCKPCHFAR
jgi:hypothetical protein